MAIRCFLALFGFFVGSEVFNGIAHDEPGKPGEESSSDPLNDDEHGNLLFPHIRQPLSVYMTGI